ncbi:MAG: hypothetical protein WCP09_00250 [Candidatus Taylorbacteria bacterium]
MYKAFTRKDFINMFDLPDDYVVEAFLSYGAWDRAKHDSNIQKTLKDLGIEYSIIKRQGFLSYVLELDIKSKKYWFVVMYGGALLSEMIHLASLFGSKKNIHIGSCGGLNPNIRDMELISPSWSYGNESTTRTYEPNAKDYRHYSNDTLRKQLVSNYSGKNKVWAGPIISNQAMMGETWDHIESWSKDGYFGVEMETATLFSVSKQQNVPSAALLYVSDNLINGQTVGDESHISQKTERESVKMDIYKAAVVTLIS